jgi:hypothetical protein
VLLPGGAIRFSTVEDAAAQVAQVQKKKNRRRRNRRTPRYRKRYTWYEQYRWRWRRSNRTWFSNWWLRRKWSYYS